MRPRWTTSSPPQAADWSAPLPARWRARHIPADRGRLWADVVGEIETEGRVLVIKRIRVTYHLTADPAQRETIDRVLAVHADACPVARTLQGCVAIATDLQLSGS